ncbi:hypothetical protein HDV05_002166, partial [Chytridiales sp. JEL 0842]
SVSAFGAAWFENPPDGLYKTAVLGLSRGAIVEEMELEKGIPSSNAELRLKAYPMFFNSLKSKAFKQGLPVGNSLSNVSSGARPNDSTLDDRPIVTLLLHDDDIRKLVNEVEIVEMLKSMP